MTEAIIIVVLLVLPFVAYALGRRSSRNESAKELSGKKSELNTERESLRVKAEHDRAQAEAETRENKKSAATLNHRRSEFDRQRIALEERERNFAKMEQNRRDALDKKEREVKKHEEAAQEQTGFLRNYFLRRSRIDAYVGQDALRKCGGVYVISRRDGLVKVGITEADFSRRFDEVRRDCERAGIRNIAPEILVPVDEGIAAVEDEVHKAFSAQREGGEWFRVSTEDAVKAVLSAAWRQHLRNTKNRKYLEPPNKGEDERRGDPDIPRG